MCYLRLPQLLEELGLAHGDKHFAKLMGAYTKTELQILDDWGLAPLTGEQRGHGGSYWAIATLW